MGFAKAALDWYCKPVENGLWGEVVTNALGVYTPCGVDTMVISISHLVLMGLCLSRIWRTKYDFTLKRFRLKSNPYNCILGVLAFVCTAQPLFRLVMGISILNPDPHNSHLAPFEIASLLIETITWCSVLIVLAIETKIYIYELRWYVRFGVVYVIVGNAVLLNFLLSLRQYLNTYILYLYISEVICQVLFGVFLLFYIPNLEPYPGYSQFTDEFVDNSDYEVLPGGEQICPERHASIFSIL